MTDMMNCPDCRAFFSEHADARTDAAVALAMEAHLRACTACGPAFALYRRVFATLAALPVDPVVPAFRRPAELPGTGRSAPRGVPLSFGWRASLGRLAAGLLVTATLVGSHLVVFQWSRTAGGDSRSGGNRGGAETGLMSLVPELPGLLRDHVEAMDLSLRSAAYMPERAGERGRQVLQADFERSELPRLTRELQEYHLTESGENADTLRRYFALSNAFIDSMQAALAQPGGLDSLRAARAVAMASALPGFIDQLRPVVAPLASGAAFRRPRQASARPPIALNADEQTFVDARTARLSALYPVAARGFRRFDTEYRGSVLAPLAKYMQAEVLLHSGDITGAQAILASNDLDSFAAPAPADRVFRLDLMMRVDPRASGVIRIPVIIRGGLSGAPSPGTLVPAVGTVQMSGTVEPSATVLEFCHARGVEPTIQRLGNSGQFQLRTMAGGIPLAVVEYPRLYEAVRCLILNPTVRPENFSPDLLAKPALPVGGTPTSQPAETEDMRIR